MEVKKKKKRSRQSINIWSPRQGREDEMNWEIGTDIFTMLCIKYITNESYCIAQRTLLSALW